MPIKSITFFGLITSAGTLLCLISLIGFLGHLWWGFELATHFRLHYAIALALSALVLVVARHQVHWAHGWAALFAIVAVINAVMLVHRFIPYPDTHPKAAGPVYRVVMANLNSANRDYPRIRDTILHYKPDFIILLEVTPWLMEQLADVAQHYPHRVAEPREDNFGIAFLSQRPFYKTNIAYLSAANLPSIVAEFTEGEQRFTVIGTHPLPPIGSEQAQDRNEQLANLAALAHQFSQPLVLLGDLNLSPWSPYFDQLLTDSGLRDSGRGRGILPSWPVGWIPLWIPIDHALFSENIRITHRETGPALGSDHYPIIIDFQVLAQ